MGEVFYKYASFNDPKIDAQLVSNARDYWYWFWVGLETSFIWLLLAVALFSSAFYFDNDSYMQKFVSLSYVLLPMLMSLPLLALRCVKSAGRQVKQVLVDTSRVRQIKGVFDREV